MEEIDDVNRVLRKTPRASTPGDCCTHTVARSMPDSPSGFSQGARFIITRSSNSPPTRASVCQSGRLPSGHPASPPVARTDGRVPLTQGRTPPSSCEGYRGRCDKQRLPMLERPGTPADVRRGRLRAVGNPAAFAPPPPKGSSHDSGDRWGRLHHSANWEQQRRRAIAAA